MTNLTIRTEAMEAAPWRQIFKIEAVLSLTALTTPFVVDHLQGSNLPLAILIPSAAVFMAALIWLWGYWHSKRSMQILSPTVQQPLKVIHNQEYKNVIVSIDGYSYVCCTFRGCSFVYNGGDYAVDRSNIENPDGLISTNKQVVSTLNLIKMLGIMKDEVKALSSQPLLIESI